MRYLGNREGIVLHGSMYLFIFSFYYQQLFCYEQFFPHIYQIKVPKKTLTGLFNQHHPCLGTGFQTRLPHRLMAVWGNASTILMFPSREGGGGRGRKRERESRSVRAHVSTQPPLALCPQSFPREHKFTPAFPNYVNLWGRGWGR